MTTPAVKQIDELFAGLSSLPSTATPQQPQKMRMSLDDISDLIASTPERWTRWEKDADGKKRRKLIVPAWRFCWHCITYIAIDADTRGGYWWLDGADWHRDDHGRAIRAALRRTVEHAGVVPTRGWNDVDGIAMLRAGQTAYPQPTGGELPGVVCSDGTRLIISAEGIHRVPADPDREVWQGAAAVRDDEIPPDIDGMKLVDVWAQYPNWMRMMDACDEPGDTTHTHARLWSTIAGTVIYAAHCVRGEGNPPLESLYWLFDDNVGNTGKTTHAKQLFAMLGTLAMRLNWGSVIKENDSDGEYRGDLGGAVLGWADEAGDGMIKQTSIMKALVSGTGTYRQLYRNSSNQTRPLVILCTANHPPRIHPAEMGAPISRRIQIAQYTVRHADQSRYDCTDEEVYQALLACGCVVCRDIMQAIARNIPMRTQDGGGVWPDDTADHLHTPGEQVLPYVTSYTDMDTLMTRVIWQDIFTDAMQPDINGRIGLRILRLSLISWLINAGRMKDESSTPRELRSDEAFRARLHNWRPDMLNNDAYCPRMTKATITVVEKSSKERNAATEPGKYVVCGISLRGRYELLKLKPQSNLKTGANPPS